jgi:predicted lipoprotein
VSTETTAVGTTPRKKLSPGAKRGIWIGVIALVVLGMILGTKVVGNDDALLQGTQEFDPATFGAENFPQIQEAVAERAVDAATLAGAIAADPAAAAEEYAVASSGGPVYSVTFTGVVGEGQSGIYEVDVEGVPDDLLIRVQTGPAINGTELRDSTGEITFGQFTNQIDYQDAASALNEEVKTQVLADIDTAALQGKTITVTGAFTLINPASWLVTPTEIEIS